jgi:hypothetical protein
MATSVASTKESRRFSDKSSFSTPQQVRPTPKPAIKLRNVGQSTVRGPRSTGEHFLVSTSQGRPHKVTVMAIPSPSTDALTATTTLSALRERRRNDTLAPSLDSLLTQGSDLKSCRSPDASCAFASASGGCGELDGAERRVARASGGGDFARCARAWAPAYAPERRTFSSTTNLKQ